MAKTNSKNKKRTLAVSYGGVSGQKKRRKIGVTVARNNIGAMGKDVTQLDELITNAQVEATLAYDPNAARDADGQQTMEDVAAPTVEPLDVVCEIAGFTIREDVCRFGLNLPRDVPVEHLDQFSFKAGTLAMKRIGNAATADDEEGGE